MDEMQSDEVGSGGREGIPKPVRKVSDHFE